MATSLQTLIPLFVALLLTVANASKSPPAKTSFNYKFSGGKKVKGLTYQGDAHFPSDTTHLRLTKTDDSGNAQELSIGRVLYTAPVLFSQKKKQADFETTLTFIINPSKGSECPVPADGLVFFVAPIGSNPEASGGSFGVFDQSGNNPTLFCVEFDIFPNDVFDPTYPHIGIDIGSQISKNVTEVDDAMVGQEVTAHIVYKAATKLISVRVTSGSKTFDLSYVYGLSTLLPQEVQVGISAATGGCVAVHDVISWSFSSALVNTKKA